MADCGIVVLIVFIVMIDVDIIFFITNIFVFVYMHNIIKVRGFQIFQTASSKEVS